MDRRKKLKKGSILLIDDSETNISALTKILKPDFYLSVRRNGAEGIEAAKKHLPDIIILDIIMPDLDGFETIASLKKIDAVRHIPVIFITGLSNIKDERKGLKLGAADYITKPFCVEIVKMRVDNQIRMINYIRTIERLSKMDPLTEIPNRRSFDEKLLEEWKRAIRSQASMGVIMIDVDHFKKFNDIHGHTNGDTALKDIADNIMRMLKRPGDFAARWGGEEFVVLLPDTEFSGVISIAEEMLKNIENSIIRLDDGTTAQVSVSIGVNHHAPTAQCDIKDFIRYADDALYAAKAGGRNRVCSHKET